MNACEGMPDDRERNEAAHLLKSGDAFREYGKRCIHI